MDISVRNLGKNYGAQRAVDDISFQVNTGEIVGLLGPNGAGKTTIMKILTCYMAPTRGAVTIGALDIFRDGDQIKKHIGYLPENNPLYLDMPVLDFLTYVARLQGVSPSKIPERLRSVVTQCGINLEKHKKIQELSKGFRQRVGLAQALIHDPEILILDEPTTGLDPNQIVEIRSLIKEIGREKTVILSTHILPEVEASCDRILIINQGKIVADGSPESLRSRREGQFLFEVQLKANEEVGSRIRELPLVIKAEALENSPNRFRISSSENEGFREALFQLCTANQWPIYELKPVEESLEEIFRDLTLN